MESEQTFGQKAVGQNFNPSQDPVVADLKDKAAEFIDACDSLRNSESSTAEEKRMFSVAITEAQTAQMWAVKAATWQR